eukprot:6133102-Pyramimonas_sp.AAC.1
MLRPLVPTGGRRAQCALEGAISLCEINALANTCRNCFSSCSMHVPQAMALSAVLHFASSVHPSPFPWAGGPRVRS